ncbi:two-component regulator propeller domain-containing protein [Hyalangium minutum]|uniref:histidine kinase n=1 Tax=Hyalangium minutum TaxID=394096 RepID=A0A085WA78_9BACT|nr:two-component regulator propeller domain-containing protein [Hyalangium minutum]KFE64591.1 hypothetical protein DB31_1609 [Hyalangium minutum]
MSLRGILLLGAVLGAWGHAWALDPDKALLQFPHRAWQTAEGLPQNSVLDMAQTPDGYLWSGTWEGLVRFDGVNFTVFEPANTHALPSRSVRNLELAPDGTLWIGTTEGIAGFREGTFFALAAPPDKALSSPNELLATRDGSLWVASDGHGISRVSDGKLRTWTVANGLANDTVLALVEDEQGSIWAGSEGGLQRWDGTAWTAPLPFEGQKRVTVRTMTLDSRGTLWAGTEAGIVYQLVDGVMRPVPGAGTAGAPIGLMLFDRAGTLWMGTLGRGLQRWSHGQLSELPRGHPLEGCLVSTLLEDREGNLWVGTEARGLHRLKDAPFTPYGPLEGMGSDMVLTIRQMRDGSIWFGTLGGGVTRMQSDGTMTSWTPRDGLVLDRVRTLAEDPEGNVWVGTRSGINRWRDGTFTAYGEAQGLTDVRAFYLEVDAQGTLWVGTPTGLARRTGERFEPFTPEGGLPGKDLSLLRASAAGGLWLGTRDGGLAHLLQGRSTLLAPERGPLNSKVAALHEDSNGVLWIGTDDGLFRWKEGQFRRFSVTDGLYDNRIFQLLEDGQGDLWMSSNKGISHVSKAELDAVAEGRLVHLTPRVYGAEDGMRSAECNALGAPAGWRDRSGRLWFPTIRGAVAYTPGPEAARLPPAPVLIEELRVDGRPIPPSERGSIPRGEGRVEIRYTSAGLRAPQQVRFRFRLEGADEDWVQAGTRREAWYLSLPPGSYRFLVEAEYADGGGAAPGVELMFELKPRFHQTGWFRAMGGLAVVLTVAGLVWLRLRQAGRRERQLESHVAQRTEELATVNADLQAHVQELQDARERLVHAEKLAAVGTLAAGVGHELNNPLSFVISNLHFVDSEVRALHVPPEDRERMEEVGQALAEALQGADRMSRIIQDLRTFSRAKPRQPTQVDLAPVLELAASMAGGQIRHRARLVKDYTGPLWVMGDETHLGQVFLNLLVNAAQAIPEGHADQHEIRLTARQEEAGPLRVEVSDTGTGIPPEVLPRIFDPFFTTKPVGMGTGLGLSLCHTYVKAMGGDIRVRSTPGQGTTFEVLLQPAGPPSLPEEPTTNA